jgi:hypothetical protein
VDHFLSCFSSKTVQQRVVSSMLDKFDKQFGDDNHSPFVGGSVERGPGNRQCGIHPALVVYAPLLDPRFKHMKSFDRIMSVYILILLLL